MNMTADDEELIKIISTSKYFIDSVQNTFSYQQQANICDSSKFPQFSFYQHHLVNKPPLAKHHQDLLVKLVQCELQAGRKVDWASIASKINEYLPSDKFKVHAMECLMLYRNKLDPDINNREWTKTEEKQLLDLVNLRNGCYNWSLIAEDLTTNRTPIECLRHYQQSLNIHHINAAPWSEEELQLLASAVELYGEGKWQHIANSVPGRTVYHCKRAWRKVLDDANATRSGHWDPFEERLLFLAAVAFKFPNVNTFKKSPEEIQAILKNDIVDSAGHHEREEGIEVDDLMMYNSDDGDEYLSDGISKAAANSTTTTKPKNTSSRGLFGGRGGTTPKAAFSSESDHRPVSWYRISQFVPGRAAVACREKWYEKLDPNLHRGPFTPEEDQLALALARRLPERHWSKISQCMDGRTDHMVMKRISSLTESKLGEKQFRQAVARIIPKRYDRRRNPATIGPEEFQSVFHVSFPSVLDTLDSNNNDDETQMES